eukprot:1622213-Alexandrium_andersonii.AAC.1
MSNRGWSVNGTNATAGVYWKECGVQCGRVLEALRKCSGGTEGGHFRGTDEILQSQRCPWHK